MQKPIPTCQVVQLFLQYLDLLLICARIITVPLLQQFLCLLGELVDAIPQLLSINHLWTTMETSMRGL